MENEIYTPMERVLIEGAKVLTRAEYNTALVNLMAMEMEMLMQDLEEGATHVN